MQTRPFKLDGRVWIGGVSRLSLAHHVDHLDATHADRLQFTARALLQPSFRIAGNDGRHSVLRGGEPDRSPRPGEGDWRRTVATAYWLAASAAFDLAADLARRVEVLQATAPKRVKRAGSFLVLQL
jgi:Protein of unknown function (DUF1403)